MRNMRPATKIKVASVEEAKKIIREAVAKDLKNRLITDNAFGLEIWEDNGDGFDWCEWYNEETGNDILQEIDEEDEEND